MGSESDREIAKKAETVLEKLGIPFETKVLSSHRNHKELDKYVEASKSDVFITIAGLSAALPGFVNLFLHSRLFLHGTVVGSERGQGLRSQESLQPRSRR